MDREVIGSLVTENRQLLRELHETREQVPRTICDRRTCCCSLLPESSFLEFLQLLEAVGRVESKERQGLSPKLPPITSLTPLIAEAVRSYLERIAWYTRSDPSHVGPTDCGQRSSMTGRRK